MVSHPNSQSQTLLSTCLLFVVQAEVKEAQAALNKQKEKLKECNREIGEKIGEQKSMQKESNEAQLKVQELEHKVTEHKRSSEDAARMVSTRHSREKENDKLSSKFSNEVCWSGMKMGCKNKPICLF